MNERTPLIMTALGLAVLLGLLYRLRRQRAAAQEIQLIHTAVDRNLREIQTMHRILRRTRGAVNQIHQYIDPVPKGVEKQAS